MTGALQHVGTHASQATQIEQARAIADVLAAMEAAKRWPRDEDICAKKMETACKRPLVAERAFWSFPRSGDTLTGPSIHLARAIGAIWTNLQWGIAELSRDDEAGVSQMIAFAWDLETNVRPSTAFIVPHYRTVKDRTTGRQKRVKLDDLRDVYENNANNGARRVREMILGLLPDWYTETAIETCRGVIEGRGRKIEAVRKEVGELLKPLGVAMPRVLARVGRQDWKETTYGDLATLRIIATTIARGEGTIRELLPDVETRPVIEVRDLTERAPDAQPLAAHVERAAPSKPAEREPLAERTRNALFALFGEAGLGEKDDASRRDRLRACEIIGGLDAPLGSMNDLSENDGLVIEAALRAQGDQVAEYVRDLLAADDRSAGEGSRQR
jgi:hypothetical protein